MEYLKSFENYKLPYQEITSDEYNTATIGDEPSDELDFIGEHWENFTKKEIDELRKCLHGDNIKFEFIDSPHFPNVNMARLDYDKSVIIKLKDEWYYVILDMSDQEQDDTYFKCDQFSGLIKLIKDCF